MDEEETRGCAVIGSSGLESAGHAHVIQGSQAQQNSLHLHLRASSHEQMTAMKMPRSDQDCESSERSGRRCDKPSTALCQK